MTPLDANSPNSTTAILPSIQESNPSGAHPLPGSPSSSTAAAASKAPNARGASTTTTDPSVKATTSTSYFQPFTYRPNIHGSTAVSGVEDGLSRGGVEYGRLMAEDGEEDGEQGCLRSWKDRILMTLLVACIIALTVCLGAYGGALLKAGRKGPTPSTPTRTPVPMTPGTAPTLLPLHAQPEAVQPHKLVCRCVLVTHEIHHDLAGHEKPTNTRTTYRSTLQGPSMDLLHKECNDKCLRMKSDLVAGHRKQLEEEEARLAVERKARPLSADPTEKRSIPRKWFSHQAILVPILVTEREAVPVIRVRALQRPLVPSSSLPRATHSSNAAAAPPDPQLLVATAKGPPHTPPPLSAHPSHPHPGMMPLPSRPNLPFHDSPLLTNSILPVI